VPAGNVTTRIDATRAAPSRGGDAGSLAESTRAAEATFRDAMAAGDADGAVAAVLALDDAITAWSADTLQSDEMDRARAARRAMVVQLGQAAAKGLRDPRLAVAPVVDAALSLRAVVRAEQRYDLSDLLRDELAAAGVEVRDTGEGVEWELRAGS
jgi:cysteinyl-tRNA synthetase